MTCHEVQTNLSLYLYGELDFAQEEALERHLEDCALCQRALAREKEWHASVNSDRQDVSFELLSKCRRDLRAALHADGRVGRTARWWSGSFQRDFPLRAGRCKWLRLRSWYLLDSQRRGYWIAAICPLFRAATSRPWGWLI